MRRLIIYGSGQDPHIASVVNLLQEKGAEAYLFDPGSLPRCTVDSGIDIRHFVCKLNIWGTGDYKDIPFDESLIWWRNKYHTDKIVTPGHQSLLFATSEKRALFEGLIRALNVPHFNNIDAIPKAHNKLLQLKKAESLGFLIPEYIITNQRDIAIDFVSRQDSCVVKPLSMNFVPPTLNRGDDYKWMLTNTVTAEEIAASTEAEFSIAPMILQRCVKKRDEIRHVQFESDSISFYISANDIDQDAVDWRIPSQSIKPKLISLSDTIIKKAHKYLNEMNLTYGVFDLIVDEHDQIWFLECNADGQWLGYEINFGEPVISEMFAKRIFGLLTGKAR